MRILNVVSVLLIVGCSPIPINYSCNAPILASEYPTRTVDLFNDHSVFSSSCPARTPQIQELSLRRGKLELLITTGTSTQNVYLLAQDDDRILNIAGERVRPMPRNKESIAERFKKYTHYVRTEINNGSITLQVSGESELAKETIVLSYTMANCNCVTYDAI